MDDDESLRIVRKKFREVKKKTKNANNSSSNNFKCDIPMDVTSAPLTVKQKALIEKKMEEDFLGKFEVRSTFDMFICHVMFTCHLKTSLLNLTQRLI